MRRMNPRLRDFLLVLWVITLVLRGIAFLKDLGVI